MPLGSKRLCVFGDSHFICTRQAFEGGLVDATGGDIEFWGNAGAQFRHLAWRNDRIEPLDDYTAGRFAKTNRHGRRTLTAADFDMVLFMGCRVDLYRLFPELLHRRRTGDQRLSPGVERRWIHDFLHRLQPYHFARNSAASADSRVVLAPISFDTAGFDETIPPQFAEARNAQPQEREAVWHVVQEITRTDGIELLRQPDETVIDGCCTDPGYAVQNHLERNDRTHKNAQYGARILTTALDMLRRA